MEQLDINCYALYGALLRPVRSPAMPCTVHCDPCTEPCYALYGALLCHVRSPAMPCTEPCYALPCTVNYWALLDNWCLQSIVKYTSTRSSQPCVQCRNVCKVMWHTCTHTDTYTPTHIYIYIFKYVYTIHLYTHTYTHSALSGVCRSCLECKWHAPWAPAIQPTPLLTNKMHHA